MAKVTFETPRTVTIQPAKIIAAKTIPQANIPARQMPNVISYERADTIDSPRVKTVMCDVFINNLPRPFEIVLWSGDAYDAIGQWTDVEADAQLNTILTT